MAEMFPKPWRSVWVMDAFRVYDAGGRHLFVITSDEFDDEDEDPKTATVMGFGTPEERQELGDVIEELFPPAPDGTNG